MLDKPCHRSDEGRIVGDPSFSYPQNLQERLKEYYRSYYEHFGIRNVADHVANRLREELIECQRLAIHESLLARRFENSRVLVVGLGTGGLGIALHSLGNEVHGIEPDETALRIAREKMDCVGGGKARIISGFAEALPYRSNAFQYVFCFTVLEHVRDVRTSLREMVRVLRPGGVFILNTPEYRFPFEAHYKVPLLLKPLPRLISAGILKMAGKPARPLLSEITYVTSREVQHLLMEIPNLRFFRVFSSYPAVWLKSTRHPRLKERLTYVLFRFWSKHLEIYQNQEYYVFKLAP